MRFITAAPPPKAAPEEEAEAEEEDPPPPIAPPPAVEEEAVAGTKYKYLPWLPGRGRRLGLGAKWGLRMLLSWVTR